MKFITLLSALIASVCLPAVYAQSQAPRTPDKPKSTPEKVVHSQVALLHPSTAPDNTMVLERDPRLNVTLSFRCNDLPIQKVLEQISRMAHISLLADSNEVKPRTITCAFVTTPVKDILDGIAALGDYEWERRKSGVLVLRPQTKEQVADKHKPRLDKDGKKFKELLAKLPADLQQSLAKPYNTPLGQLSPEMQQAVQGMLSNLSQMYPPSGDGPDILSLMQSNLSGLSIGWQVQTQEDGTYYYLNAALPNSSGGTWLVGHN